MQTIDLVRLYTARFQEAGIPYIITGSIACVIYGEPRLTHDVDLVVEINPNQIDALRKVFPDDLFYVPPKELLLISIQRTERGSFNIIHHETGFKADVYLVGRDAFQKWGLAHARSVKVGESSIAIAPPEYVIARKLEYFREGRSEKHVRDIVGVLRKMPEITSSKELLNRIEALRLNKEWMSVLEQIPNS